ncbi:hypothetical protein GQ53DRAFT_728464 [Thozetella sp. PMI_491]|nr:hypothetical protein GQ53DRAFT_728464 [Thozetella sp. PMI_491]
MLGYSSSSDSDNEHRRHRHTTTVVPAAPAPGPAPVEANKKKRKKPKAPIQKPIDRIWKRFSSKRFSRALSVLPFDPVPPSSTSDGSTELLSAGYERAAQECRKKVRRIIEECRRVNMRYQDPGFDVDWDVSWEVKSVRGHNNTDAQPNPGADTTMRSDKSAPIIGITVCETHWSKNGSDFRESEAAKSGSQIEYTDQFWAKLQGQMRHFMENREAFIATCDDWLLPHLLQSAKDTLLKIVPPEVAEPVHAALDVKLLTHQLRRATADLETLTSWIRDILKQHCTGLRDGVVDRTCEVLSDGFKDNDSEQVTAGLRSLLEVLELSRLDALNNQIRQCPPNLVEDFLRYNAQSPLERLKERFAENKPSQLRTLPNKVSQWTIHGELMGIPVAAFPDSGADACFISPGMMARLGVNAKTGTERLVNLANDKTVASPGSVDVPWKFADEEDVTQLTCYVLPGCAYDLVLGGKFLEYTQSLTTRRHRIRRNFVTVPRRVRVNLLGEGKQRLFGYINSNLVAALPDTGSDAMIISQSYAQELGLKIDVDPEDMAEFEFADGTTALSDGIVRDVTWSVGNTSIKCDFYVLDNLRVDVVLAKDYLFEMDILSTCKAFLAEDDDLDCLDLCGVRLVRVFGSDFGDALDHLEDESIEDVISPDAFSPAMINREWARRDRIRDEISNLNENQKAAAQTAEARRQEQWERARAEVRQRWAQTQPRSQMPAPTAGGRTSRLRIAQQSNSPATRGFSEHMPSDRLSFPDNTKHRPRRLRIPWASIQLLPLRRNSE